MSCSGLLVISSMYTHTHTHTILPAFGDVHGLAHWPKELTVTGKFV